ncbi:unnamed protein product, partial [Laminaria digitata]
TTFGASPGGGAISAADSVVTMTDCVAAGNSAYVGDAVSLWESNLVIFGVTSFTNNDADTDGGAIFAISNSTITVDAVVVESSYGGSSTHEGGSPVNSASISECRFFSNAAKEDGGALHI